MANKNVVKHNGEKKTKDEVKEEARVVKTMTITAELLASLRRAETVDAAAAIVAPKTDKAKAADATYAINEACKTALPVTRGARLTVYLTAVRLGKDFKVADIVAALPDVKAAAYWARKLAKDGFLRIVETK